MSCWDSEIIQQSSNHFKFDHVVLLWGCIHCWNAGSQFNMGKTVGGQSTDIAQRLKPLYCLSRTFSVKRSVLTTLDEEYMQGVSELYSNEPRQFHVRVPCHSRFNRSHQCSSPATIVFRVCTERCVACVDIEVQQTPSGWSWTWLLPTTALYIPHVKHTSLVPRLRPCTKAWERG